MNLFSISELEQFSGIKAHTIRIWEKRYNALKPERSTGNTRYYDSNQLRRLLNLVSLSATGYKVSELSKMPDSKIFKLINKEIKESVVLEPYEYFVSQMIVAAISYDEVAFDKLFSNCYLRFGLRTTYIKIIQPLLVRVGLMWGNATIHVSQEHFLSNIIRQKLFTAIDSLPPASSSVNSWLLFLPENEFHDIGLLFSYYLIRISGRKVIFLGSNVPFESLKNAVKEIKPSNIFFFLIHNNSVQETQKYFNKLQLALNNCNIFFSGNNKLISNLKMRKGMKWLPTTDQLKEELAF